MYEGEVGLYDGEVGLYEGEVGLYDGEVGLYDGEVGLYEGEVGLCGKGLKVLGPKSAEIGLRERDSRIEDGAGLKKRIARPSLRSSD